MIEKHLGYIRQAAEHGAQIICLQEIFTGRIFAPSRRRAGTNDGVRSPTDRPFRLMQELAKKHTWPDRSDLRSGAGRRLLQHRRRDRRATADYLGKYRKTHIPHVAPGFWEKFYFRPGNLGYPVFDLGFVEIGVYICYDRHFPEGARALGLNGAEIVFNPSATVAGLSEYLWKLEQPAHAVANGYFVAAINRVGTEAPWNIGEFYGQLFLQSARPDHCRRHRGIRTKC